MWWPRWPMQGGRKFLVASYNGNGFVVPEDEVLGTTRKGKQVLNLKAPDKAAALTTVDGDHVATIGENRKMLIFKLDQVPEMTRGRGVRLQRYLQKGLSDITTFDGGEGLNWTDSAGRSFTLPMKELKDWRGDRAAAGRIAPEGFPENNKFGRAPRRVASDRRRRRSPSDSSTRHEQQRAFRLLQQRRGGVAEEQLVARAAADAHHHQIVLAARHLLQDGFVRRDVGAHRGAQFAVHSFPPARRCP